jgi:hypothetical protein
MSDISDWISKDFAAEGINPPTNRSFPELVDILIGGLPLPDMQREWIDYARDGRDSLFFFNAREVREQIDLAEREPEQPADEVPVPNKGKEAADSPPLKDQKEILAAETEGESREPNGSKGSFSDDDSGAGVQTTPGESIDPVEILSDFFDSF